MFADDYGTLFDDVERVGGVELTEYDRAGAQSLWGQ
jgi:hypothetical protein